MSTTAMDPRLLARMVANDIIPRLLLAHKLDECGTEPAAAPAEPPTQEAIARLVDVAVAMDTAAAVEVVEARLLGGESYDAALLDFVGGAARMLGDQWLEDQRTFAEVTIGLATLHRVVSVLRYRLKPRVSSRGLVVLLAAPGEQHTLAIHVLGDLLAHAGWDADVRPVFDEAELIATVASEVVVMVGISVSSDSTVEPLARIVTRVRAASLNRDVTVMLGGGVDLGGYAREVGAHYCSDAREALDWLDRHASVAL
ncbi:MAG: cobalamin-dependent protein [Myxococcales bacterium]|nr:cobalamin-dependent protein [Myxococcales bacterium]